LILGHAIALDATEAQEAHFRRACGVARYAYNWALQTWKEMHAAGEKPSAVNIKARWNAHRKAELPWSFEVTKCASGQAVVDLGTAFANFFRDLKKPKNQRRARFPRFKSKRSDNGFALWNDQFAIKGDRIRIARLGWVKMHEPLRFAGKIVGARIARIGTRWHVSVQVDVGDVALPSAAGEAVGVDLGIETLATLSTGEKIAGPKPRRRLLKRLRRLQRRVSLQRHRAKKASNRQRIRQDRVRRLNQRMACIRKDAAHKLTTSLANRFQTIVIEGLNISGMSKNHALAGSILDAGWHEIRRQLEYKTAMRGGRVVVADRFFPSSKLCSDCGHRLDKLPLSKREWACPDCGAVHDRDVNAAINLKLLVGPTRPESSPGGPAATRGEIGALAASQGAVKLRSANRELSLSVR
jgi:putative transposase